jgi:hypothetical protein
MPTLAPGRGKPFTPDFIAARTQRIRQLFHNKTEEEFNVLRVRYPEYTDQMIEEALAEKSPKVD